MVSELHAWLKAAGRIPRVTPAQEIMLARQIQAGVNLPADSCGLERERITRRALRAQRRLTEANLRLVWRIVDQQYRRQVPAHQLLDLLQVGSEGVFHAARKFNPDAGVRFSTYAAWWIRQRCQLELDRMGRPIRVPTTLSSAARRLPKVREAFLKSGTEPTVEELAVNLKISHKETRLLLERVRPVLSLDLPCGQDEVPLGAFIAAPESDPPPPPPAAKQLHLLR